MTDPEIKLGSRLDCAACGTQVIVMKAPQAAISCCGTAMARPVGSEATR